MDLRLLREWIRNPLLLEGVDGQDLEQLLLEAPAFEAGQLLSLQRMKINHSSRFSKAMASYTTMTDQGQWLYRAIERQQTNPQGNPQSHRPSIDSYPMEPKEMVDTVTEQNKANVQQTRLDWFTLLGQVDWKSMETDDLDLLYAEYKQTDYLEASSDFPSWDNDSIRISEPIRESDSQSRSKKAPEEFHNDMNRIREMAAKSLDLDEVPVSESLAELYLEQGQKAMAARIYRRLMARFPAKISYFRECIDQMESYHSR